ncbi:MAG: hypothetical protein ACFFEE_11815 [Candidatus Thorarchaeota archaeon]
MKSIMQYPDILTSIGLKKLVKKVMKTSGTSRMTYLKNVAETLMPELFVL